MTGKKKPDPKDPAFRKRISGPILLDLAFLELDVLARNRIIFPLHHFLGHIARIFLRDVEESGACR